MASIRVRKKTGRLFIDFRYRGVRCREQTALADTAANRRKLKAFVERMEADMLLGTFRYSDYFPDSPRASQVPARESGDYAADGALATFARPVPKLEGFAWTWFDEHRLQWKESMARTVRTNLRAHILPMLGNFKVDQVTRAEVLHFRSELAKNRRGNGRGRLSNDRINHVMTTLNRMMGEAAKRWEFTNPCADIDRLSVRLPDVHPFSLDEVRLFLANVRADFRDYYTVRFFTGLRTAEIDGLKWRHVDFERNLILIRETLVDMRMESTKNRHSERDVVMSAPVREALIRQYETTSTISPFVFCRPNGEPLDHRGVNRRVWTPTLRFLGIPHRRPYETRHTAATLWLAAGENPEWIARQLGHSSTQMLFQRYSRFVPNLTRRDGSAIEALLRNHVTEEDDHDDDDA